MEWIDANVPDWLKGVITLFGTIGGIALTYTLSRLGMGHGKEKAKEEAVNGNIPPPSNSLAALTGIGGVLLERSTSERMIEVATTLAKEVAILAVAIERMHKAYEQAAERAQDEEDRKRIREDIRKENEIQTLRDQLNSMRSSKP